jgi:hypothetical protein
LKGSTSKSELSEFAYDELELQSTTESIAQQRVSLLGYGIGLVMGSHNSFQVTFDKAVGPKRSALEAKYPIDNDPLFPGKRIYTDPSSGFQFELNSGRLTVWASHLVGFCSLRVSVFLKVMCAYMQARGTATLDKPPATPLFDCQQRIKKLVPTSSVSVSPAVSVSVPVPIAAPQVPATSTTSITELLLLQLLQTQQMTMHASHSVVPQQQAQLTGTPTPRVMPVVPAGVVPPSVPPSPAKHRHVTLDEYCAHYAISDVDRGRLQKLDFQPGDPIEKLERVEWHDEGGFQRLGWDRMLAKNREFLRDVRAGTLWV